MACPITIKKNLVEAVEKLSGDYINKSPVEIKILKSSIDDQFGVPVVDFIRQNDSTYKSDINIPQSLVDEYYDAAVRVENREFDKNSLEANESVDEEGNVLPINNERSAEARFEDGIDSGEFVQVCG
jgi:hypothetical protein